MEKMEKGFLSKKIPEEEVREMYEKKKQIVLVACKCGRVKRRGEFLKIRMSLSGFIEMAICQNVNSIDFLLDVCDHCQENERVASPS